MVLTTLPFNAEFDLAPYVGQRDFTFIFERINGLTGQHLGFLHPIRQASLTHDTSRTIKRQLTLNLGEVDSATISPLTDRIDLSMVAADGSVWPLGRYMFTDNTGVVSTGGTLSNVVLNDEMFLVDQEIIVGVDATGTNITDVIVAIMKEINIPLNIDASPFTATQAWGAGANRGPILEALAVAGDYFSPWFGNDKKFRMIRSFDPATQVPQFDYDAGGQVLRAGITETSNILTSPNRFIVISNTNTNNGAITGIATIPTNAPNSVANRGFYITQTINLQLTTPDQAQAVATNFANRFTAFETVNLQTGVDPRHNSYDVINWQGELWLELSWSIDLRAGTMSHVMRKAYTS